MTNTNLYIVYSLLVILIAVLIAYWVWTQRSGKKEGFNPLTDAATPLVRDQMGRIEAHLDAFLRCGKPSPHPDGVTMRVREIRDRLSRTPRTYANCLAFYRGLQNSDRLLLAAADMHAKKGMDQQAGVLRGVVRETHRLGAALGAE
jgi:hypothetical protein